MRVVVNIDLPTDNADVLAGTILDPVPPGRLLIYLASSQRDGILTITGPGITGAYRVAPILRANGIPDINADLPYVIDTPGGKVLIAYDEVTAGDAFATIIHDDGEG